MAEASNSVPPDGADAYSGGRSGNVAPRRTWLILVVTIAAGVVTASAFVLSDLSSHEAQAVLPLAWHLPDRCYQYCQFASAGGVLYTLIQQSQPAGLLEDLATYFSLQAYNWSSGSVLWSVANFTVWGLWASTSLFVNAGTVAVVVSGDGEWVPGQNGPPVWLGTQSSTFVFEWNASTGDLLNETHYGSYASGIGFWGVSESQGWIAVADAAGGSSTALIQSIPMVDHSGTYDEWNATLNPGSLPSSFCDQTLRLFQVGGVVSLWVTGGQGSVTVLSGSNGSELWQGEVPGWSSMVAETEGCQPESLAAGRSGLYYLAEVGGSAAIEHFDLANQTSTPVVNLSNVNATLVGLSLLQAGELAVTDTQNNIYSVFSLAGAHLWSLGLNITVGAYSGDGYGANVWGTVVQPVELGVGSLLLSMEFSGGGQSCSGLPCNGSLGYSLPMDVVNASSGRVSWDSSYETSVCFGPCSSGLSIYAPVIGSAFGPYAVFEVYSGGSGSCSVAYFAAAK